MKDYEAKYMDSEPELLTIDPLSALREQARNPCHDVSSIKPVPSSLPPPPPLKASPAALLAGRVSSTQGAMFSPPILSKGEIIGNCQKNSLKKVFGNKVFYFGTKKVMWKKVSRNKVLPI